MKKKVCALCGKEVTEDEFCYGCNHYVCEDCDIGHPIGDHKLKDHQEEEE